MIESNNDSERLYLHKSSSGHISVPCGNLAKHQIDGIRFLYKQYVKKKQGVIMNYPSGCGASVQVALFLQAIRNELDRPVLILYDTDEDKQDWLERFEKWTTIRSDKIGIDINSGKKLIHITQKELLKFWSPLWSIIIVKSDVVGKTILKYPLTTKFKIWITSIDMKKDHEMFRSIYSWMYPKSAEVNEIIDNTKNILTKSILMDSLFQDVLSTERGLKPFRISKRNQEPLNDVARKVTRKNKDATGLKIKRSKKNAKTPSTDETRHVGTPTSDIDNFVLSNNNAAIVNKDVEDNESKLDVESFIRDNEPLESDCHLNIAVKNLENGSEVVASDAYSNKTDDISADFGIVSQNGTENSVLHTSTEKNRNIHSSFNLNESLYQRSSENDNETKDSMLSTMPVIQSVFSISTKEEKVNCKVEVNKKEENNEDSSDESIDVGADQEAKVELATSVTRETDNSFDSKIRELEERAYKKFKGSFLDNIF